MMTEAQTLWAMVVLCAFCLVPVFRAWRESRRRRNIIVPPSVPKRGKWGNP